MIGHDIPVWFLVLSLFLPRIALFAEWVSHAQYVFPFPQPWMAVSWALIPRIVVLIMVYSWGGPCPWFFIHLGAIFLFGLVRYRNAN